MVLQDSGLGFWVQGSGFNQKGPRGWKGEGLKGQPLFGEYGALRPQPVWFVMISSVKRLGFRDMSYVLGWGPVGQSYSKTLDTPVRSLLRILALAKCRPRVRFRV